MLLLKKKYQNNFLLKTLKFPLISKAVLSSCLKNVLICVKKKLSDSYFLVSLEVSILVLLTHHTVTTWHLKLPLKCSKSGSQTKCKWALTVSLELSKTDK